MRYQLVSTAAITALLTGSNCNMSSPTDGRTGATPRVTVTTVFTGTSPSVESVRMDWSLDDQWIAFKGGVQGNSDVYKVSATASSTPIPVTAWDNQYWERGGYAPCFLDADYLAYYVGWIDSVNDQNMHIMRASPAQVADVPAPFTLHTFNGDFVGQLHNAAASPSSITMSSDGSRALVVWETGLSQWSSGIYLLDWTSDSAVATKIDSTGYGVLSRDGMTIVLQKQDFTISYRPAGVGQETAVGTGQYPSMSGNGLIGWVAGTGYMDYMVYDTATHTTKTYPCGVSPQCATLSSDGKRIAFRTFSGSNSGISVGELID
jgi:hypothetical protein